MHNESGSEGRWKGGRKIVIRSVFFWGVGEQLSVYVCHSMCTKKIIPCEWMKVVLVENFALDVVDTDII